MLPAARRLKIPYTVLLVIVGFALGGIDLVLSHQPVGMFGDFLGSLKELGVTSDMVLFVFLPALVFESALTIDVHRLIDDLAPILFLAIIGLLISTFVVGISLWGVSQQTLLVCMLLGAIISATDPVAVVAIFKELQAPKRLVILVEGESLFNDATAIVMFTLLSAMIFQEQKVGFLSGTLAFVKVFFGGMAVGYLCGIGTVYVLKWLKKLPLVKTTLTFSLAYLSFILAEHYLHVSGVMATVTAGLVLSSLGQSSMPPTTWVMLVETWEHVGFWANSIIFILVGITVPEIISQTDLHLLGVLAVLILCAVAVRAAIIYGVLPLISFRNWAVPVSTAFKTVMFWGGLRGAVSLALALAVMENPRFDPEIRFFIGSLVAGFVLFTLFVNATTIGPLIRFFGLHRLSPANRAIRNRAMEVSHYDISNCIESAAKELLFKPDMANEVVLKYRESAAELERVRKQSRGFSDDDNTVVGLTDLVHQERETILKYYEEGFVDSSIAGILQKRVDDLFDGVRTGNTKGYETAWRKGLAFNRYDHFAAKLHRWFGYSNLLSQRLADRFEALISQRRIVSDIILRSLPEVGVFLGKEMVDLLNQLLQTRLAAISEALILLRLQYPEYAALLEKRYLSRIALRLESAEFNNLLENSLISKNVFQDLENELEEKARQIEKRPRLDLGLIPEKLVARVPFFSDLSIDRIQGIVGLLKTRLVFPGEKIISKGDRGDAMYFISSGCVEVGLKPEPAHLGSGDFFGEIALLKDLPRTADVTAKGLCDLLILYARDFKPLLDSHQDLREIIERVAKERLGND